MWEQLVKNNASCVNVISLGPLRLATSSATHQRAAVLAVTFEHISNQGRMFQIAHD